LVFYNELLLFLNKNFKTLLCFIIMCRKKVYCDSLCGIVHCGQEPYNGCWLVVTNQIDEMLYYLTGCIITQWDALLLNKIHCRCAKVMRITILQNPKNIHKIIFPFLHQIIHERL